MNELQKLFTQAHTGTLPPDFEEWGIANDYGWTVAHEAAYRGHLPPDFDRWTLATYNGVTVRDVYNNLGVSRNERTE